MENIISEGRQWIFYVGSFAANRELRQWCKDNEIAWEYDDFIFIKDDAKATLFGLRWLSV